MTHTVTLPATRRSSGRRWTHAHKIALTVVGCLAGVALMAAAQIPLYHMQAGILSAQASTPVGYVGGAPVVAPTDFSLPVRLRNRAATIEPLPAR